MPLNTGYERVIASRTDDIFATTASVGGKVLEVSPKHIKVEYQDGRVQAIELGERFGVGAGAHYSHQLTTGLKAGETFEAGDTIAYNSDFFAPDFFNSKGVVWKAGVLATTAVMETVDTLEDSSTISERLAKELTTKTVKNREIVLNFNQAVRNLVSQGDSVDLESILCTIEDAVTADSDLFDDDSLDMLKVLSAQTPRAKFAGKVAKVEVYYHGDKEDMSESLRAIANESDKRMGKINRRLGRRITNGRVDGSYRVGGNPLELDTLVIKIAIVGEAPAGVGDKGVFGNQLKTIFGRVMSGTNETADGRPIDAIFGFESINARIVSSPIIIGTFNTLLKVLSKKVAETYRKK